MKKLIILFCLLFVISLGTFKTSQEYVHGGDIPDINSAARLDSPLLN
ncbi:hypothetical protein ACQKND_21390 [Viridibacillus arvi]